MSPLFRIFLVIVVAVVATAITIAFAATTVDAARARGGQQAANINSWYCHDYPEKCGVFHE